MLYRQRHQSPKYPKWGLEGQKSSLVGVLKLGADRHDCDLNRDLIAKELKVISNLNRAEMERSRCKHECEESSTRDLCFSVRSSIVRDAVFALCVPEEMAASARTPLKGSHPFLTY